MSEFTNEPSSVQGASAEPTCIQRVLQRMSGVELIAAERERQIRVEGWNDENDDVYVAGQLAEAASCYCDLAVYQAQHPGLMFDIRRPMGWPWREYWKPSPDPVRNLVKAGALIAAEIDRLQRRDEMPGVQK